MNEWQAPILRRYSETDRFPRDGVVREELPRRGFDLIVSQVRQAREAISVRHTCLWNYRASDVRDNVITIHLVGETIDAKRAHQRPG